MNHTDNCTSLIRLADLYGSIGLPSVAWTRRRNLESAPPYRPREVSRFPGCQRHHPVPRPLPHMSTRIVLLSLCCVLAGCASLPDVWPPSRRDPAAGSVSGPGQPSGSDDAAERPLLKSLPGDFVVAAVEKVGPSVVRIDTLQARDQFPFHIFPGDAPPEDDPPEGQGSGFITRSDGIVLTNHHVVEGAERVTVTLRSGRSYTGQVLGSDMVTDLGIVKIDGAENLPVARLGNSDEVRPGEWAIAIGNPLGLNNSVSLGIVSATDRTAGVPGGSRVSYIQTDAAINPGNSGGPLINHHGQVIGINTFIRTSPGGGISFAIPINKARDIGEQIIAHGRASHPFIGVSLRRITQELAGEINQAEAGCTYPETDGVVVVDVLPDHPAARAGLQSCDVIRTVAGVQVRTPAQVQVQVDRGRVGKPLKLDIERQGLPRTLMVVPDELDLESF